MLESNLRMQSFKMHSAHHSGEVGSCWHRKGDTEWVSEFNEVIFMHGQHQKQTKEPFLGGIGWKVLGWLVGMTQASHRHSVTTWKWQSPWGVLHFIDEEATAQGSGQLSRCHLAIKRPAIQVRRV